MCIRDRNEAFDHQLTDQLPARRADGKADGDLLLAGEGARDQQVRHVGASDQQHQPDHAHENDESFRKAIAQLGVSGAGFVDVDCSAEKLLAQIGGPFGGCRQRRFVLADLVEKCLQRRRGGLDGVAGFETREHLHPALPSIVHVHPCPIRQHDGLHQDRHANLRRTGGIESTEPGGGDADDGHRVIVHQDLAPDDIAISVEAAHPIVVAEDDVGVAQINAVVLFGAEHAAESGLDAEHREVIAGDEFGADALGLIAQADGSVGEPATENLGERRGLLLKILIDGIGMHAPSHVGSVVGTFLVKHDQLVRILHGQQAEHHLVQQREDGGIGTDAESEREHGNSREQRIAPHGAKSKTQVRQQALHGGLYGVAGRKFRKKSG